MKKKYAATIAVAAAGAMSAVFYAGRPTPEHCQSTEVKCGNISVSAQLCGAKLLVPGSVVAIQDDTLRECLEDAGVKYFDGGDGK